MEHDQRQDTAQTVKPGDDLHANFRLRVPQNSIYTRPYWHRDDPETEAVNHIDEEKYATLPFPPPALRARVEYAMRNDGAASTRSGITTMVVTPFLDDAGKHRTRPLAIVPAFSVMLEPGAQVISTHNGSSSTVTVGVTSNLTRTVPGVLRLELPSGWHSEPAQFAVELKQRGEKKISSSKFLPPDCRKDALRYEQFWKQKARNTARGTHWSRAKIWAASTTINRRGSG